jgi:hypothetical protein
MRSLRTITLVLGLSLLLSSCGLWNKMFKPKYGCKTNGKNIGAEKLLDEDPETKKALKKAKKFKA